MARRKTTKRSAGILLISKGRVLVLQRGPGTNNAGLWDLPGGQRDDGESTTEAAWREAIEEIGALPQNRVNGRIRVVRDGGRKRYDIFVCAAPSRTRKKWQPAIAEEHSAWRWVDLKWCLLNRTLLHPVLRALFDDAAACKALRRALDGKRSFRRRVDRHDSGVFLRPVPRAA